MAKVDSSKLLSSSKSEKSSSAMVLYRRPNLASTIKPIQFKTGSAIVKRDDKKESKDVNNKLVQIEKFFKSDLLASKKGAETKREDKESDDFKKAEDKLETSRSKQFQLPSISASLPKLGFLDRVKRFIFFTAIGWLFPKLLEFMPKLRVLGNIISTVEKFAVKIFTGLFDGFVSLVKFGGDLKEKTLGFISTIPGANNPTFQSTFKSLQDNFDTFVNAAIISSVLAGDIGLTIADELGKLKRERAAISAAKQGGQAVATKVAARGATSAARSYSAGKSLTTGTTGATRTASNFQLNRQRQQLTRQTSTTPPTKKPWWQRIVPQFKTPPWIEKILTKFKSGPLKKLAGPFSKFLGKAVPFVGAVVSEVDARQRFARGEVVGGWLARIGGILDGFAAGAAIAGLPFVASIIGAPIGGIIEIVAGVATALSIGIDVILLIHDILGAFGVKTFSRGGRVVGKYQGGGISRREPTRGGRGNNSAPTRTYKPETKRIPIPIPPKPKQSRPGKDVGGVNKIQRLYPDSSSTKVTMYEVLNTGEENLLTEQDVANPYKVLTSTAKITKTIPLIGSIMGAGLDLALGEKPSQQVLKTLTMGIGYLIDTFVNQSVNANMASMSRDIMRFSEGGIVKYSGLRTIYQNIKSGEFLYKMLGPIFNQKVNEIIKAVKKEVDKKKSVTQLLNGSINPEAGLDGTTYSVDADSPDFWLLVTAALFENDNPTDGYQGAADVAQAIYNRLELPGWPKTIRKIILQPDQFSPVGEHGGVREWSKINSKDSAIEFARRYKGYTGNQVEAVAAALLNSEKQRSAREFVGPRDSFLSDILEKEKQRLGENGGQGQISDDTQKDRYGHSFGFEPGGRNYPRWKANRQLPAGPVPTTIVTGEVTAVGGGSVSANNATLVKLGTTTNLFSTRTPQGTNGGRCVEAVIMTMQQNGIVVAPNGTTADQSHSRGLIVQLVKNHGWASLPNIGRRVTLSNAYGSANVNVMTFAEYVAAVNAGLVPSGALVFQSRYKWTDRGVGPGGFDAAIARNGGRNLFNGIMNGNQIYGTVKEVIVLVPKSSIRPDRPSSTPTGQTLKSTQVDPNTIITIREGADGKLTYSLNGQPLTGAKLDKLKREHPEAFERPPQTQRPSGTQSSTVTAAQIRSANLKVKLEAEKQGGIPVTIDGQNYHFTLDDNGKVSLYKRGFGYGLPFVRADKVDAITPFMLEKIVTKGRTYYENFTPQGATPPVPRPPGAPGGPGYGNEMRGGLIEPTKSRLPIPNSYASYENSYGGEVAIAIQPIIITRQIPTPSSSRSELIMFPVPVEVNTNMDIAYNRSRGY